ncbi:MAG TPA: NADH-quinone oxidoreductase subunit NuoK [Intrasporangium sp.]|uniref:NADH-quinone oxidoreductase subunit NuoK n=1 Tax=Intrasporangium sp. TaxID=1925024 RepID=UPI002F9230D0
MSLVYPAALAAVLAGIGVYGVLARRNAVLVLIGVELILNAANLLLVTAGSRSGVPFAAGPVLALFVITIAAAEVVVALAIILVMFRRFGHIDLTATPDLTDEPEPTDGDDGGEAVETSEAGVVDTAPPDTAEQPSDERVRRLPEGVS